MYENNQAASQAPHILLIQFANNPNYTIAALIYRAQNEARNI